MTKQDIIEPEPDTLTEQDEAVQEEEKFVLPVLHTTSLKLDSQLYWLKYYDRQEVSLDVLTPNGLLIQITVNREATLFDVKEELFETAQKQPLFGVLQDKMAYMFSCVNILTAEQEIFDDDRKVCEIKPFFQLLRLIEKQDDRSEKQLNAQIGFLIGKGLHEFDALKISEVNNFRWRAREFSNSVEQNRHRNSWVDHVHYNFPVRVESSKAIPKYLKQNLEKTCNQILLELRFENSKHFRTMNASCFDPVNLVVQNAIRLFNLEQSTECGYTTDFALKVSGQEEYLFGTHLLIQYANIRESLSNSRTPSFVVKDLDKLKKMRERSLPASASNGEQMNEFRSRSTSSFSNQAGAQLRIRQQPENVLDLPAECFLAIQVRGCIRINCADGGRVALLIGVYHGNSLLCARQVSHCATVRAGRVQLDQRIEFDLRVSDLPRMARYSMLLFEVLAPNVNRSNANARKPSFGSIGGALNGTGMAVGLPGAASVAVVAGNNVSSGTTVAGSSVVPSIFVTLNELSGQVNPLCWVNCTVFDYKGNMRVGGCTLPMWPSVADTSQTTVTVASLLRLLRRVREGPISESNTDADSEPPLLNPLGTVVYNPEVDNATCLTVSFISATLDERPVYYPSLRVIVQSLKQQQSSDSQVPATEPPNIDWLDNNGFEAPPPPPPPPSSLLQPHDSSRHPVPGTPARLFTHDSRTGDAVFSFAAELVDQVDRGCERLLNNDNSRPDSGEFVPILQLQPEEQHMLTRHSIDETSCLRPPNVFSTGLSHRSSSLCNLSVYSNDSAALGCNTNSGNNCEAQQNCKVGALFNSNNELRPLNQSLSGSGQLNGSIGGAGRKASKAYLQQLREICSKDPLHELTNGDTELLWYLRGFCLIHLPHSLSHLLAGVRWQCSANVQEMLGLLVHWPLLSPELGLQLLDYAYCDLHVRTFAVRCLSQMSDEQLELYLLQLVQALKFESYLQSELAAFLLRRALANQHIGHYLFWLLRSEMHESCVSIKFGLLLEAYCRGAQTHMKILTKQLETLNKFREINEMIREEANKRRESREKLKQSMQNILSQSLYKDSIKDIVNPLNPRQKLGQVKIEKCKFMDSKMKPLWLVFSNDDLGAQDIQIIYKNGDDLRQDMLTLQMLRIMDKLWKDEGLDLRMSAYNVISTDFRMGLIEVVQSSNTVANIQKQKAFTSATSAFQKSSLLQWLREQNPDEEQLMKAIDEFTKSCAGYCVATYVLGIADRHSDNIMLRSNGQLFHIDFGHILGKFKEKWKIRRERVPFVLTNDFVYVITNGNSKKNEAKRFQQFLDYCEKAFLILRRKGTFMIALFAMMLSTGLEMSCVKDLDYLRETLVLQMSETEALKHFRSKFDDSLKNSWKTSFNWLAHNIAKDNK